MLQRKLFRFVSAALFALGFVIPAVSQVLLPPGATDTGLGGGNAISGTILLSTGQRLERRVAVRLRTMTKGDSIAMSDEYGNFTFRGLVSGDYTIVIDKEKDLEPYSQLVAITQFRGAPPQVYNLSIRLQLKERAETKPGVLNAEFANVPPRALRLYNEALELARAGKNELAIDKLRQAISEYSDFMLAYNELGVQYTRLGNYGKADESLLSALKIATEAFTPLLNHGIALALEKQFGAAVAELSHALRIREQSAMAHYFLGQALANLERFDESEQHLTRALSLGGPEVNDAHKFLGAIYNARGERQRAVTEFETYLRLAPKANDAEQVRRLLRQLKNAK